MAKRQPTPPRPGASPGRAADRGESSASARRRAEVVLDLDVEKGRVHLVLANCGDAVATDIRVQFSRPLTGPGGSVVVSALPVFERLGVLRPGRTLRVFWDAAPALAQREQAAPFNARVSWTDRFSRARQRAEYGHDPSIYLQWPECVEP